MIYLPSVSDPIMLKPPRLAPLSPAMMTSRLAIIGIQPIHLILTHPIHLAVTPHLVTADGGRPQLPRAARRSFLMYGDAPKRESTISLPTHVESKDDGETFQPVKSLLGRSSISEIPVHKPARPGIIKSVSRLGISNRNVPFGSNHYTENIRLVQKHNPSDGEKTLPSYDFLTAE